MSEKDHKLSLLPKGRLELKKTVDAGQVRQSFSHGRSKVVSVEVRRKRSIQTNHPSAGQEGGAFITDDAMQPADGSGSLTAKEKANRLRALKEAHQKAEEEARRRAEEEARREEGAFLGCIFWWRIASMYT